MIHLRILWRSFTCSHSHYFCCCREEHRFSGHCRLGNKKSLVPLRENVRFQWWIWVCDEYSHLKSLARWFCRHEPQHKKACITNSVSMASQQQTEFIMFDSLPKKKVITEMREWDGSLLECNEFNCVCAFLWLQKYFSQKPVAVVSFYSRSYPSPRLLGGSEKEEQPKLACALDRLGMWQTILKIDSLCIVSYRSAVFWLAK